MWILGSAAALSPDLIPTALLILAYAWQIIRFAFDGRSSNFIWLYYLLVLTIPIIIKDAVQRKHIATKILGYFLLTFQLILLFVLYLEVVDTATIIWIALSSALFLLREQMGGDDDPAFSPLLIPKLTLILSIVLLANTAYREGYFLWNVTPHCGRSIYLKEIPGVTDKVKEIIESKQYLIMNKAICVTGEGQYNFELRPTYNKYFSKKIHRIGTPAALDEMVREIQYVTKFKRSNAKNYAFAFGKGFVDNPWEAVNELMAALINRIIYPIDTLKELWQGLKEILTTLFTSQNELITVPTKIISEHLDEIEVKIMAANKIDRHRIMLAETLQVIKEHRNLYLAGEIGFEVAAMAEPIAKVGAPNKIKALVAKVLGKFGLAEKGRIEDIRFSYPNIKSPKG